MNKLLQTSVNRSLHIELRSTEEGSLAVKVACTVGSGPSREKLFEYRV